MTIVIIPKNEQNLYGLLLSKEQSLRGKGAFRRAPGRVKGYVKWHHVKYNGWIWLHKGMSGVVGAAVECKDEKSVWQILTAFIGFADRNLKSQISSITIHYPSV